MLSPYLAVSIRKSPRTLLDRQRAWTSQWYIMDDSQQIKRQSISSTKGHYLSYLAESIIVDISCNIIFIMYGVSSTLSSGNLVTFWLGWVWIWYPCESILILDFCSLVSFASKHAHINVCFLNKAGSLSLQSSTFVFTFLKVVKQCSFPDETSPTLLLKSFHFRPGL